MSSADVQHRARSAGQTEISAADWAEIRRLAPSPRVEELYRRFTQRYAELGRRICWEETDVRARNEAFLSAYRATAAIPATIRRRARALTEFAERIPVVISPDDLLAGRYGTDDETTNALAGDVSTVLARMVLESRLENGVRPYPGFFGFAADIYALGTASPDGRRKDDLISYGVAPSSAVVTSPTTGMRSAAHVAQNLAACGNPLAITLQPSDVRAEEGVARIRQLVEGYFALGGSHVHFNITSADELRKAKADPEHYASLTVRVRGYSARFVTVDSKWQDAIIERAERGR